MTSVGEARRQLPDVFIEQLYHYFPALLADKILQGFIDSRWPSLRVNTLKTAVRPVMRQLQHHNMKYERVQWSRQALVIKNTREKELEQLPCYKNGEIYLQSLSSMIPPLILRPKPNDIVLDLAAAPGGKTTQMAAIMKNTGEIWAIDKDEIRFQRMCYNLDKQGMTIVEPICIDGTHIGKRYPNTFDKVLIDAPCSGEGLFLLHSSHTYRHWRAKSASQYTKTQRKLLASAVMAAKPGGLILYSTCTINPDENEVVINQVLEQFQDQLSIEKIALKIPSSIAGTTQYATQKLHPDLVHSLRIIPNKYYEGFFCCLLRKQV